MKIALAGNPNSGKTTLFNAITGKIEKVGNWAGVTIAKKEASLKKSLNRYSQEITVVDLPGAYSMSPYTSEESITREFVANANPDVIVNIVDATNLGRSLFFTTQLIELGIPVVIALNKSDLAKKRKLRIDQELLAGELNCPVVAISAQNGLGLEGLVDRVIQAVGAKQLSAFSQGEISGIGEAKIRDLDEKRYRYVDEIVAKVELRDIKGDTTNIQDRLDRILANKWLGIPIFALIIWLVFSISQTYVGTYLADILVGWIDRFYSVVAGLMGANVSPILATLLLDGIIGGLGAVVGFLPLIMVLFFLLALLEDSGYMARVAMIMDRFFKWVGLSGKSIIPMIVGTGCAIPGIMATRTIQDDRQRRTTAMLTPFMPCGAKLPVIALFAGVFFEDASWVSASMYFLGITIIILSALIIRKITGDEKVNDYFIMELPEYRIPSVKRAAQSMLNQAKAFIVKASTIILLCNAAIQVMSTFTWQLEVVSQGNEASSILASVAAPFALILIPLGFGVWQLAAAAITGFIAKENVVGTLAVVFSITNFINVDELALVGGAGNIAGVMGLTSASALAYLAFNLFTPPCFAAIGAMNAELGSKKWLFGAIAFQLAMGYVVAFVIYQAGTLFQTGSTGQGFLWGLVAVGAIVATIAYLMFKRPNEPIRSKFQQG